MNNQKNIKILFNHYLSFLLLRYRLPQHRVFYNYVVLQVLSSQHQTLQQNYKGNALLSANHVRNNLWTIKLLSF